MLTRGNFFVRYTAVPWIQLINTFARLYWTALRHLKRFPCTRTDHSYSQHTQETLCLFQWLDTVSQTISFCHWKCCVLLFQSGLLGKMDQSANGKHRCQGNRNVNIWPPTASPSNCEPIKSREDDVFDKNSLLVPRSPDLLHMHVQALLEYSVLL